MRVDAGTEGRWWSGCWGGKRRDGDMLHLESRTHRHDSDRFYLGCCGLRIVAFHFDIELRPRTGDDG
jgi:hypothetical protein